MKLMEWMVEFINPIKNNFLSRFTNRTNEEILMDETDNAEISILEQSFHNPHDVRQNVLFGIETGHHQWNIGCALVVGDNQRFGGLFSAWRNVVA